MRLLLRLGMARLNGLDELRAVMESRLGLKEVMTLRRGFLGEDMVGLVSGGFRWCTHVSVLYLPEVHSSLPRQLESVPVI